VKYKTSKGVGSPRRVATPCLAYFKISVMTPAPTVRPPSRMAKRLPVSMATGEINVTFMLTLSPGITISTPPGNSMLPVMSIVRR